jgi:hypothetical protein
LSDPHLPERDSEEGEPTPWGFRIVLALVALYLIYRLIQGIVWVIGRF